MITITQLSDLHRERPKLPGPLGLVPTMGFLHAGHLSLVRQARVECASVAATIFVNPTQFGPTEDLNTYPRDIPRDLALLEETGADLVWTPTPEIIYPPDFQTEITVRNVAAPLEGARRPGHFTGVATVVAKLFNAIQPQKAYFGQKDAQQTVVLKQMVRDLNMPVELVICPIVREPDGLAMSSRTTYLNPEEREAATVLYRSLTAAEKLFSSGSRTAEELRQEVTQIVAAEPLAKLQYVSCAHPDTLEELEGPVKRALLSMAVYVGKTRLIDNLSIEDKA